MHFSSTGLVSPDDSDPPPALEFLDSVLRGVGQVMLQDNSFAGLLFLVGIFYNSTIFGIATLAGTIASTVTAMLLGVDRSRIRQGLFGFNGALVGIALLYFLSPDTLAWAYVVLAAAFSTVVMAALSNLLDKWKLPALTAPFVFVALCFVLACVRFGRLHSTELLPTAGLPKAGAVEGIVTLSTIAHGLFSGVAQVFFQANAITGIIFVIGLLISSRAACIAALLGSLIGLATGWGLGAAEPAIRAGAFGFNSVLTAIALGSLFFTRNLASNIYTLLGVITTAVVFAAVSAALEPIGVPALTSPFVIVVWLFLFAAPTFPRLRSALGSST